MDKSSEKTALAVADYPVAAADGKGLRVMTAADTLPIAKFVTNEQLIAEERFLARKETEVERRYAGIRGYLRIIRVTGVLGRLALYLYLDQLDMHRSQQRRHLAERFKKAQRLTRAAVYGEWLYSARVWLFHQFMSFVRVFVLGRERNRDLNQEKQAVWLKEKLIELGPTFIKIGQSMGTRADLLPLPFVAALGELQDNVPPFDNEIAFARIEKELGLKINEVYQ
ncbi:MAG TPA: hypothetical protein DEA22_07995, partial [Blastocatellia bacterium]|nr:hypothetical protein [Blastocatellia bacterium]